MCESGISDDFARPSADMVQFPARQWTNHEHMAAPVVTEAQRLVNLAGSVELAKESLKATVEPPSTIEQTKLAKQFGYDTYEELVSSSTLVVGSDNSSWCVTMDRNNRWVVWNVAANRPPRNFDSMEEALGSILDQGGYTG